MRSVDAAVEHGGSESVFGDAVAVAVWKALDEAMQSQTPQIVSHLARAPLAGIAAQQRSEVLAQFAIAKAMGQEDEQQQRLHQGLHARIGET